ncbi:MAG TPA: PA0069 family radical SAM protein [Steroidobacteraceae bacterium]|jgi:DNA repair photolyase|nr:PA0069 family radical SAM protein [Steroidobacteraceae bacterium]
MPGAIKGRGAVSNPPGRFDKLTQTRESDGWHEEQAPNKVETVVLPEPARSIISRNDSPDIGFSQSINPYRGCAHGCIFCYARPSHAYLGLSPGLDFETKLFYKADAAKLLEAELAAPKYRCTPIMLGANTDPYQPIEKKLLVTRSILEVLSRCRHPVSVTTKGALVARDVDLLSALARDGLTRVMFSIPTLSNELKRSLEPQAAAPSACLKSMRVLADAGVPVGVLVAPIIPVLTEHEIESVLEAAREHGASLAGYTILRLPWEVKDLFREWLAEHFPERAAHVMSVVRAMRGERDNDPDFGTRMHATGPVAELIRQRFQLACKRLGFPLERSFGLPTNLFRPPARTHGQLSLEFPM